ncbi:LANO_0H14510g1_1 [Lachancea nothofagi CBS 11611]|uniref:LANO_0H14510g1_1 n=1 Tax=Lachancea nothofagi CBS 11611 TaxID=1266666 RepID=A0A1G4KMG9_9SACH|nr:LANO_0H14510g1_1 [Lachancea nothofagi CBS 11611]
MADASILNELTLAQVLEQASDPRHAGLQVQKLAEQQLKAWSAQKGYHYLLQSIYLDLSCPLNVRWLAIIQFKNGVDRHWRSTRVNAIGKEEKTSIRARLFDLIDESNNQLCIQNSQATARIARLDFPSEWPNLFEQLEQLLANESIWRDNVKIYNLLLIMNQVVKILATARIGRCRPAMQSKTPLVFPLMVRTYLKAFNEWTTAENVDEDSLAQIQVSYIALKVLRRLTVEGYESPHREEPVREFLQISIGHLELLLSQYDNYKKFDFFEKYVRCYGKLYHNLICASPSNFILLPCSLQILVTFTKLLFDRAPDVYNENPDLSGDFWEQVAIRGFSLLKKLINFIHKKGAMTIRAKNDKAEIDSAIRRISTDFLNEQLIQNWVDLLVDWYIKLRLSDLENWSIDPEEWMNEQLAASYEYQIRPCAENFFQDLIHTFPETLVPYLLNKIQTDVGTSNNTIGDLLKKDAIFASFQLSASSISEAVDFDSLLVDVFLPEATNPQVSQEQSKILKRRIALVINEWCGVKCSESSKQLCYKLFLQLLTGEDDRVIQLSCVQTLRTLINDWSFSKESFQPYLDSFVFVLLKKILPVVSLTETRLYVLNTLSEIIFYTKPLISKNLLVEILQAVPNLWELSVNEPSESILANALLRLLRHSVCSLGKNSTATWQIALPVTQAACNASSPQYSLLYEDGFDLWQSLLQNYSDEEQKLDSTFLEMIPFLENAIQNQTEILPTLLEIVQSYVLILGSDDFMRSTTFGFVFSHMSRYLLKLRDDSFDIFLLIVDTLALLQNPENINSLLNFLFTTGALSSIFDAIFREEQISCYQTGQLLRIIARIAYYNATSVLQFLEEYKSMLPTAQQNSLLPLDQRRVVTSDMPSEKLLDKFMTLWILCFKEFYDPKVRKIHILGISSMLRTLSIPIIAEFPSIASIWVEFLEETNETSDGDCVKFHLKDVEDDSESGIEHVLTCEQSRLKILSKTRDPAHNVSLKGEIAQILQFLETKLGPQFQNLLAPVDGAILENLQIFLSIPSQK